MDTILTVNGGSSSLKCGLYTFKDDGLHCLYHLKLGNLLGDIARFDIMDERDAPLEHQDLDLGAVDLEQRHQAALKHVLSWLDQHLSDVRLIATGHRIVHGGDQYSAPVEIGEAELEQLRRYIPLAPLHQPYNLRLLEACAALAPDIPRIGCFDTMFHSQQPRLERLYAIPRALTEAGVHKYGFHGLSYDYIQHQLLARGSGQLKTVVCHLGAGASMCAIRDGISIASSMGFTAVDGLPMGSRCGNIDPGVLLYLMRERQLDLDQIETLIYKQSGWLGVSGISSDMITLHQADSPNAEEAIDLFCYRAALEIGRLSAALEGLEQLVFTGGVGENDDDVRARILSRCGWLGVRVDAAANAAHAERIDAGGSSVEVRVIPTNEEAMIAQRVAERLRA
ncbi:acetate/propionate family kinase [Marinobacterium sp. D7]|uniref:acetate/propionate family kinase n=1 Tax=Marinobacterium ramblicola TaxID=2849041 RepID=UPI001C2D47C6|nr:acetate/propionate family kinase [Marinobacterium ramblicola]MBV1786914.1 acetate/propionate family kinase [Marinobacterium ramblicola]